MRYVPTSTPNDARQLRLWIAGELSRIARALGSVEVAQLEPVGVEPARPRDGMIAYADGIAWNPGAGVGFYGRESGAWVKL